MPPMLTITLLVGITAFITAVISATGKCPIWVPVILLTIAVLLRELPR